MKIFSYQYGVTSNAPITFNYNLNYIVDFISQIGMNIRSGLRTETKLLNIRGVF